MIIDVSRHLGAVRREVTTREHEGRPANAVVATRDYDTTVEDLWDAVTSPARIRCWFLPVSGDFRVGGRYQLQGNAGGTITACQAPSRLALTWEVGGRVSWLHLVLVPSADGTTRLRLEHIAPASGDVWTAYGPGAAGIGWELGLLGLALHVETHAVVDPEAVAAWTASVDGLAFIQQSSAAWCAASVASGADPRQAREAASRAAAFYTGEAGPGEGD